MGADTAPFFSVLGGGVPVVEISEGGVASDACSSILCSRGEVEVWRGVLAGGLSSCLGLVKALDSWRDTKPGESADRGEGNNSAGPDVEFSESRRTAIMLSTSCETVVISYPSWGTGKLVKDSAAGVLALPVPCCAKRFFGTEIGVESA